MIYALISYIEYHVYYRGRTTVLLALECHLLCLISQLKMYLQDHIHHYQVVFTSQLHLQQDHHHAGLRVLLLHHLILLMLVFNYKSPQPLGVPYLH